ncbi:MAG: hypothetical protein ACYDC1_05345 [Limisphaerales bacterium]
MSNNHYFMTIKRKDVERIADLTWEQYVKRYGWGIDDWEDIGGFMAFALNRPILPDEPTPEQMAPILKWTIRKSLARMSPQYYIMLLLGLGEKVTMNTSETAYDCDALDLCALIEHQHEHIDDRTLWAVLTLNSVWSEKGRKDLLARGDLNATERKLIREVLRRYGPCRPLFDWQPLSAVRDGHSALREEDTQRFSKFIAGAWKRNPVVWEAGDGTNKRFRDFELVQELHGALSSMRGDCLVHYFGP